MAQEIRTVPAVALRGSVVFPRVESILTFGRSKSKAAVNASFAGDRLIAIFTQKDARVSDPHPDDLYKTGTLGTIQQLMPTDNEVHVLVHGVARIRLEDVVSQDPFLITKISEIEEVQGASEYAEGLARNLTTLFEKSVRLGKPVDVQTVMHLLSGKVDPRELTDQLAYLLDLRTQQKQELLEEESLEERLKKISGYLTHEVGVLELEKTISTKTQKRFEEQMRKAILHERQKTIAQELKGLGEEGAEDDEIAGLRLKIKNAHMPRLVHEKAEKELARLSQMPPHNPENGYIRNYLDWLCDMPWNVSTPNNVSIKNAGKVLDHDHYALKKAKERILEFLAVMHLKEKSNPIKSDSKVESQKSKDEDTENLTNESPTILCFIGPPGVGKTSIGRSIARALGRKFVRVSLGGIRDEAEIRGHRRTYVGALPGRIIQGVKNAGSNNPVFMLDEVDKLGQDFRGDPASALLEALDPEQNKEFSDHYLEVPYNLCQVMFICTGNVLENIPIALRDRMEVIRFAGYTEDDKYHIGQEFLWPKQLKNHGLPLDIEISAPALREVISRYTRESGVRNLERALANLCRKMARQLAEGKKISSTVNKEDIRKFLGPQQFRSQLAEVKDEIGVSTGLAVTATGGEILFVETALMPGRGKLVLTGQLGDVMKESAQAAFSYARSHWRLLGLKEDFARRLDVHIHVPEGAVPKDGPSAGVAMATSLISALTNTKTRKEVGMTGEITLRGRVMEIGGVKEKVIAAHRAGLKTLVLPIDNKKDIEEIPEKVQKDIKFVFAEHLDDVLEVAFKNLSPVKSPIPNLPTRTYAAS
ncbi:MAG: endopeptidase La [Candidatus Blackburnbacteria bacterium RIFCSPLOWO2_01_FULL_41_27]|uniref:Lon protease n=1 Tax=Candidatus Blackburnbacteria bacterium RIFCSPLOWO2_01_FULL_41_27 TaxID=1797520 RepID=A0A1G1VD05_9BACT|nr:MAG: endopeptidase La [Candidatus Blackburnbacteria bacterium RIFCSPLOWO2_01_FULL_41_27]